MKKVTGLFLGLLLLGLLSVRADLVIIQRIENLGQNGDMVIKIKGDKIRTDVSPTISTISNLKTGEVTTLMHAQKAFMTMSAASLRQMMKSSLKTSDELPNQEPTLRATGGKLVINSIETDQYESTLGTVKVNYWIAKNFPDGERITALYQQILNSSLGQTIQPMAKQPANLPGVPIRTQMELAPNQKITVTILSIQEQTVNENDLTVPKGYTPLPTPEF